MKKIIHYFQKVWNWGLSEIIVDALFPSYSLSIATFVLCVSLYCSGYSALAKHLAKHEQEEPYDAHGGESTPSSIPSIYDFLNTSPQRLLRQAQRDLKAGHPFEAIRKLSDVLSNHNSLKKKQLSKATSLFRRHYSSAIKESDAVITRLSEVDVSLSERELVNALQLLVNAYLVRITLHKTILGLPKDMRGVGIPSDDLEQLQSTCRTNLVALQKAKKRHGKATYQTAKQILDNGPSHRSARQAYELLAECQRMVPNYPNAAELQKSAKELSTYYVRIKSIRDLSNHRTAGGYFLKAMQSKLAALPSYRFLSILDPSDSRSSDLTVQINFLSYSTDRGKNDYPKVEDKKTTVTHKDGSSSTVRGTLTSYFKWAQHHGQANFELVDLSNGATMVKSDPISGYINWESSWGRFRGDSRVLGKRDKEFLEKREQPYPPEKTQMLKMAEYTANNVSKKIARYFQSLGQ